MTSDDEIPETVAAACHSGEVLAGLTAIFARNAHAQDIQDPGPGALARTAVAELLRRDTSGVADVGGLRLHLTVPGPDYGAESAIHVSAWDDDGEVWRSVGRVALPAGDGVSAAGR